MTSSPNSGGDDNIKGGDGNDVINGGPGANLILGGAGNDFIVAGADGASEVFAGTGDDFILGSRTTERILGNEGNDWIERGTFDGAPGDNFDEIFAEDKVTGHDVFLGDGSTDEFIGEGGDDIFVGSAGINKMDGMSGFDWATYKDNPMVAGPNGQPSFGVYADLLLDALDAGPVPPNQATLDQYAAVEGISGSAFDDILYGSDVTAADMPTEGKRGSVLTAEGIALITGLQQLLGAGVTSFDGGNIMLGGDGDDTFIGRGGDDIIDGDRWLDVNIGVFANNDGTGALLSSHKSMTTLVAQMFSGAINPGQLRIVREIKIADGTGDVNTAVYSGNRADYTLNFLTGGVVTVTDDVGEEGTDTLHNIEIIRFADQQVINNTLAIGSPAISDNTPTEGQTLTASPGTIQDPNGLSNPNFTYQWQVLIGGTWTNIGGANSATFTPSQPQVGMQLRVIATFTDNLGSVESIASQPTTVVGDLYVGTNAANTFNGTEGSDDAMGRGGADTLNGNGGDDLLNGEGGNDTLNGGAGNDTLIGGAGNDQLNGGLGDDDMQGGAGNDTYTVDSMFDVVTEGAGQGTDTILTDLTVYTLPSGVENLTYTGSENFTGTGNGLNNTITSGAGNDILDGGGGVDRMVGGSGDDTYYVDIATDVVVEAAGGGIDTVFATVLDTLGNNVENLTLLGTGNFGGNGNGLANIITGNTGNNTLNGGAGNDELIGGQGNDNLIGGTGNDIMRGDEGNDTLDGGGGDDAYYGGIGDDMLVGGSGNDTFYFELGFGNDTISSFDSNPTGGQDMIDLTALNIGVFSGPGAEVLIAQSGANTLITIGSDTITLLGVAANTITEADFILV